MRPHRGDLPLDEELARPGDDAAVAELLAELGALEVHRAALSAVALVAEGHVNWREHLALLAAIGAAAERVLLTANWSFFDESVEEMAP